MKSKLLLLNLVLFAVCAAARADDCLRARAAFDLGSSGFKLKVAEVDVCLQKIGKVLLERSEKTALKDAVANAGTGRLPEAAMALARKAVADLLAAAKDAGATEYFAVGTQIFREAGNGEDFFRALPAEIQSRIISQRDEAVLGYVAAVSRLGGEIDPSLAVWDIGGGSMQVTARAGAGRYETYLGTFASNAARDFLKELKGLPATARSPNPIGADMASRAASEIARKFAGAWKGRAARIVGIGRVHGNAVLEQVNATLGDPANSAYTSAQLDAAIAASAEKDDAGLSSSYPESLVSNLLLVKGFLSAIGADRVEVLPANLADALLVSGFSAL